jgi:enoyl-CoA hydratase/carnithine racemase
VFTGRTHEDLPPALDEVALDLDNHAFVITGTGDSFMDKIDGPSLGEIFKPGAWRRPAARAPRSCSDSWTCRCR